MIRRTIPAAIPNERIVHKIFLIRGKKVMLDRDIADLYGVETKVLNQAVRRNKSRFPEDFMFQLGGQDIDHLKSQIVTSNEGRGGRRYTPHAGLRQKVEEMERRYDRRFKMVFQAIARLLDRDEKTPQQQQIGFNR